MTHRIALAIILLAGTGAGLAAQQIRARDLGIPLPGTPGPLNAITDVAGVEVGHVTVIRGDGPLMVGQGPVRTGVTAVLPRGRASTDDVFAAWFSLNGNGEMTGTTWVEESGFLGGPVMITNTHSVGVVHAAVVEWAVRRGQAFAWSLPVVAETWDGPLNDINGFHVTREHATQAIESARPGPVTEGSVGGGTGMRCHGFKGGIGTASRVVTTAEDRFTLGVLVQCNYGTRRQLRIAGIPAGEELAEPRACYRTASPPDQRYPVCGQPGGEDEPGELGSIIIVVATDAPLLPHQLKRVARRAALGVGRMGGIGGNSSGDIFLTFSTANPGAGGPSGLASLRMLPTDAIDPLFEATIDATEEAILNALVAARDMVGANDLFIPALPHDRVRDLLRRYGRR